MKTGMFCFEINTGSNLGLFSQYECARKLFKAGKKRECYQKTQDILDQSTHAMDILDKDYSDEKTCLGLRQCNNPHSPSSRCAQRRLYDRKTLGKFQ
jgi:hypothetical protein